jgi:hypothetical protein
MYVFFSCLPQFPADIDCFFFCRLALKTLVKRWSGGDVIYLEELLSNTKIPVACASSPHSGPECTCWQNEEEVEEEEDVVEDALGIQDLVLLMSVCLLCP